VHVFHLANSREEEGGYPGCPFILFADTLKKYWYNKIKSILKEKAWFCWERV